MYWNITIISNVWGQQNNWIVGVDNTCYLLWPHLTDIMKKLFISENFIDYYDVRYTQWVPWKSLKSYNFLHLCIFEQLAEINNITFSYLCYIEPYIAAKCSYWNQNEIKNNNNNNNLTKSENLQIKLKWHI